MKAVHTPVMRDEVTEVLAPAIGKRYIDATLGGAGHTMTLLAQGATVVGIDRDQMILSVAGKRIADAGYSEQFTAVHQSFGEALRADNPDLGAEYDGILFDLGVSSLQLDTAERGFSFMHDAPLDMRMDQTASVTAQDLVNGLGKRELSELFTVLGEERYAKHIAEAIVKARKVAPIRTTGELARLISSIVPRTGKIHPATRVFQALRMAVNSEREELKAALPSALSRLSVGGVLAIISFQSLEDAIITTFMTEAEKTGSLEVVERGRTPSQREVYKNPRSRSAVLRVGRRVQ